MTDDTGRPNIISGWRGRPRACSARSLHQSWLRLDPRRARSDPDGSMPRCRPGAVSRRQRCVRWRTPSLICWWEEDLRSLAVCQSCVTDGRERAGAFPASAIAIGLRPCHLLRFGLARRPSAQVRGRNGQIAHGRLRILGIPRSSSETMSAAACSDPSARLRPLPLLRRRCTLGPPPSPMISVIPRSWPKRLPRWICSATGALNSVLVPAGRSANMTWLGLPSIPQARALHG
jgi:hypothetical protein